MDNVQAIEVLKTMVPKKLISTGGWYQSLIDDWDCLQGQALKTAITALGTRHAPHQHTPDTYHEQLKGFIAYDVLRRIKNKNARLKDVVSEKIRHMSDDEKEAMAASIGHTWAYEGPYNYNLDHWANIDVMIKAYVIMMDQKNQEYK